MIGKWWMHAASIAETLALWAASLGEIKKRIRPLFGQERVATNAGLFLEGLLGDKQRKTGWIVAPIMTLINGTATAFAVDCADSGERA